MQTPDGTIRPLRDLYLDLPEIVSRERREEAAAETDRDMAAVLRRIADAGGREVPLFEIGAEVSVNGGRFRVLAFGGKLLVLEGLPR